MGFGVEVFCTGNLAIFLFVSSQLIVYWYMSFPALLCYFYQIYTLSFCILRPLCTIVLFCHSLFLSNVSISFTIHHSLSSDCLKLLYCLLSFISTFVTRGSVILYAPTALSIRISAGWIPLICCSVNARLLNTKAQRHSYDFSVWMLYVSAVCFWRFPKNVCFGIQQMFLNNHNHWLS